MSNATFHNFTDTPFTGYWDGKPKTFKAGESVYMPRYLAEHFAKHLTNRVLVENKQEVYTSPKKPEDVPQFMAIFNKAFIPDHIGEQGNALEQEIDSVRKNEPSMDIEVKAPTRIDDGPAAAQAQNNTVVGPGKDAQIITPPGNDEDDEAFDLGPKT